MGGEKRYDLGDVTELLAAHDAAAMKAAVRALDGVKSDLLARTLLAECLDRLFEKWGFNISELVEKRVALAKQTVAGDLSRATFAVRRAQRDIERATSAAEREDREWDLLRELETFRAAMMEAFCERRGALQQPPAESQPQGDSGKAARKDQAR